MNQLMQLILEEASRQLNVTVDGTTDDLTYPVDDHFQVNKELESSNPTHAPTVTDAPTDAPLNKQEVVGFVVLAIAVALLCVGVYFCYSCWKQRQDQRFMNYVNTRADSVLGDMVMVPTSFNEDDDEDRVESELI